MDRTSSVYADAVIVAAGSSRRMDGVDKLAMDLAGRSVLEWATLSMAAASSVGRIVIVTSRDRVPALREAAWVRAAAADVVAGGARRQDSVLEGIRAATAEVVLVHDGARPFVAPEVVDAVARTSAERGAAIPILPVVDSLKQVHDDEVVGAATRDGLYRAQTPQGARRTVLLEAAEALAPTNETFTDEAELLARYGVAVTAVAGDPANFKLTLPSDVELARAVAEARTGGLRSGFGTDSHPFGPEIGLRLGGTEIADAPRLWGHSDGDVALHAICDGLLGAAGLGDLGRLAPSSDATNRGIDSRELLLSVVERLAEAGWRPATVDLTLVGARPRLGGRRLDAMRSSIAELLGIPVGSIGVKASTGNLSGDEGAGRVISAAALVGLARR